MIRSNLLARVLPAVATASLLTGASLAATGTAAAADPRPAQPGSAPPGSAHKVRLTLPAPTGRAKVGVTELHLVDRSRRDPWVTSKPYRELMVSVWYPARDAPDRPLAPQMPAKAAEHFDEVVSAEPQSLVPPGRVDWAATRTHARTGAPVDRRGGRRPVVLYSPGHRTPRALGTSLVEDLASRGYVVVSMDHTYDPSEVEFPGGRVEAGAQPERPDNVLDVLVKEVGVRSADTRFVLDRLARLDRGGDPDAEYRPLPRGIRGSLDLRRVGMFGHSLGGAASAQVMHDDRRVDAGIDMDGAVWAGGRPLGSVVDAGLDRPFMLMNSQSVDHGVPELKPLWDNLRGWRRNVKLAGSEHNSYTDLEVQVPQLVQAGLMTRDTATQVIGTADPARAARALDAQRAVVASFFDLHLRHRDDHVLDGPSSRHPDLLFVP